MRETKQVTITLLPVAVEFDAKPGDRLMILGDLCIGVDTSHRKAQPKLLAAPANGVVLDSNFQAGKSRRAPKMNANKMRDMILTIIKDKGEIVSADMTKALGLPQESRIAVTTRISELLAEKKIKVLSGDRTKRVLTLA